MYKKKIALNPQKSSQSTEGSSDVQELKEDLNKQEIWVWKYKNLAILRCATKIYDAAAFGTDALKFQNL